MPIRTAYRRFISHGRIALQVYTDRKLLRAIEHLEDPVVYKKASTLLHRIVIHSIGPQVILDLSRAYLLDPRRVAADCGEVLVPVLGN